MSTVTVYSNKDALIDHYFSTENYGTLDELFIGSQGTSRSLRNFIGFDFSSIPARASITSAQFKYVYIPSGGQHSSTILLDMYRVTGPWTETGITWENQPAVASSPAVSGYGFTVSSSSEWRSVDITNLVQELIANSSNSFMIRNQTEGVSSNYAYMYAREGYSGTYAPRITINYTIPFYLAPTEGNINKVAEPKFVAAVQGSINKTIVGIKTAPVQGSIDKTVF